MSIDELKKVQERVIKKNKIINIVFGIIMLFILGFTIYIIYFLNNMFNIIIFEIIWLIVFEFTVYFMIFNIVKNISLHNDKALFEANYKKIFVLESLKEIFDNLNYNPNEGVTKEIVSKSEIIYLHDRFFSNDYISGTYKNINFEQSDVRVEKKEVDSDNDVSWIVTFLGRWMKFDFNKNFRTNVIIFDSNELNWWRSDYNKIELEDDDFNKTFSVYAQNEHDAFYILTPHFMERMKNIEKTIKGRITFGFINNRLYIALNNLSDSFEYNIFKPINDVEIKESIMRNIKIITDFVDELNLDNDLFKEV